MAGDETNQTPGAGKKWAGWFKAALGGFAGLLGGALMMYLSPLLDRFVKPPKPVANFAVDLQGLTVTFRNRSSSRCDGWWDFGDGSPLEPVHPKLDAIAHSYARPGTYTVKLSIHNVLNEESERTVSINLDNLNVEPPDILSFQAIPISPNRYAPATFRVLAKTRNANLCIWDTGEEPVESVPDPTADQDHLVTFTKPGGYTIKLLAINGKQVKERSDIVYVDEPPAGALTAVLNVTKEMTQVARTERPVFLAETFQMEGATAQPISRQIAARSGSEIVGARLEPLSSAGAHDLHLQIAADRLSVELTGELVRESGNLLQRKPAPQLTAQVVLTEERRTLVKQQSIPVTTTLPAPGSIMLDLPPCPRNCTDTHWQFQLELREGDRVVWRDSRLPHNTPVMVQNRNCFLTATPTGEQMRLDLVEIKPGRGLSAN